MPTLVKWPYEELLRTLRSSHLLIFPNRLACFPLRLFSSNSDVLELAIIHLHQLPPLPGALTAQSVACFEAMEDLKKRNWRRFSIFGMQVSGGCGRGFGHLAQLIGVVVYFVEQAS
jgi:hypothetical protein